MKSIEHIHTLAIQYFNGTISPAGEKELFHEIEYDTEVKRLFKIWEDEWVEKGMNNLNSEMTWKRMQSKIDTNQVLNQTKIESKREFFLRNWFKIASCITLLLLLSSSGYLLLERNHLLSLTSNKKYFVCSAPYGSQSRVELPDGTVVLLNAGSSLRYSHNYGAEDRTVTLEGEGYFEVTKQKGQNFQVHTNAYNIVVKGTKFNISAYSSEQFVTTTLVEGLVEIAKDKSNYILHPGEEISLDKKNGKFSMRHTKADASILWSKNQLDYSDITLMELIPKLSRKYDVNITINKTAEQYANRKIRISLKNHESIDDVFSALEQILPITAVRTNQNIEIQ